MWRKKYTTTRILVTVGSDAVVYVPLSPLLLTDRDSADTDAGCCCRAARHNWGIWQTCVCMEWSGYVVHTYSYTNTHRSAAEAVRSHLWSTSNVGSLIRHSLTHGTWLYKKKNSSNTQNACLSKCNPFELIAGYIMCAQWIYLYIIYTRPQLKAPHTKTTYPIINGFHTRKI